MPQADSIARFRTALDAAIVGQGDAKMALALAWLAGEHALLIGPSGCGKSALAEAALAAMGGRMARVAFHRDTRAAELLGEISLVRTPHGRGGQRLALRALPGALASAERWLLDDLERAPGEALAPLLRMLGERAGPAGPLRLASAVATLLPRAQARHADPLEPAQLDRFALQVRLRALALAPDSAGAAALLAREARAQPPSASETNWERCEEEARQAVSLPDGILADWLRLWRRIAQLAQDAGAAPPSDRVVSAPGLAVLRAHARIHARSEATRADLRAAHFMLAARVPEALARAAEQLVERAATGELMPASGVARAGRARLGATGAQAPAAAASRGEIERRARLAPAPPLHHRPEPTDVSRLVRALAGRIDRAKAERADDPGGSPRRRAPLRSLADAGDADAAELALFADAHWPGGPAANRRERRGRGGALALLRDVSASMEGARTRLASDVVAGVVRAAAKRRMRVGYVEFHHEAEPALVEGALFHRRYRALLERARLARAEGRTSYAAPLRMALDALRALGQRGAHLVLLSDGVPVAGDPRVLRERALAVELGARIHTVFLGAEETPVLLTELAEETGGLCFRVTRGRTRAELVPARGARHVAPPRAVR